MKVILSQRVGSITVTVEHTSRDPDKLTTPGPAGPDAADMPRVLAAFRVAVTETARAHPDDYDEPI